MYDSSLLQKVHDVRQLVGVLQHFIWSESLLERGKRGGGREQKEEGEERKKEGRWRVPRKKREGRV